MYMTDNIVLHRRYVLDSSCQRLTSLFSRSVSWWIDRSRRISQSKYVCLYVIRPMLTDLPISVDDVVLIANSELRWTILV